MAVDLKKLVDLRIDTAANVRAIHDVIKGGANVVNQSFKSVSTSNSNLDFVIQTPGLGVYLSRRVTVKSTLKFSLGLQNASGSAIVVRWGRDLGCTAFPFNSLISSATVQINTSSFNTQVQQTLPLIKRMCQTDEIQQNISDCASGLGQTAIIYQPGDGSTAVAGSGFMQTAISSQQFDYYKSGNPAGVVFNMEGATSGTIDVTGQEISIPATTSTVVNCILTVYEPLLCQPFLLDDEEPAFINTNLVSVRLNLTSPDNDLARVIRMAYSTDNLKINSLAWRGTMDQADLYCTFITPPAVDQIPTKCIYPTTFYNPLVSGFTTTAISARTTDPAWRSSNVITLNTAPDALAIYAIPNMPTDADGSGNTGTYAGGMLEDLCLSIDKIDITWNNNPSLLVTMEKQELWRRSLQNGLPIPWFMFRGTASDPVNFTHAPTTPATYDRPNVRAMAGSPILLALNKDIPVEPGVGAGVAGVYTLVVKVQLTNQLPFAVTGFRLFVVPINSQYLVLNSGATSDVINTVATEAVVAATQVTGAVQTKPLVGGSRTGDSHIMSHYRAFNPLSHVMDMGARAASAVASAAPAAASFLASKRGRFE